MKKYVSGVTKSVTPGRILIVMIIGLLLYAVVDKYAASLFSGLSGSGTMFNNLDLGFDWLPGNLPNLGEANSFTLVLYGLGFLGAALFLFTKGARAALGVLISMAAMAAFLWLIGVAVFAPDHLPRFGTLDLPTNQPTQVVVRAGGSQRIKKPDNYCPSWKPRDAPITYNWVGITWFTPLPHSIELNNHTKEDVKIVYFQNKTHRPGNCG